MKKLTIITVRKFPKEEDYQEYKRITPLQIDWNKLENDEAQVIDNHQDGEIVRTTVNLYEELPLTN